MNNFFLYIVCTVIILCTVIITIFSLFYIVDIYYIVDVNDVQYVGKYHNCTIYTTDVKNPILMSKIDIYKDGHRVITLFGNNTHALKVEKCNCDNINIHKSNIYNILVDIYCNLIGWHYVN